jgi:hypothetical protein
VNAVRARVNDALFGPETGQRLWFVHTAMAVAIFFRVVASPYRVFADQPSGLFRPTWYLAFLDRAPSEAVIALIQYVGGLAALLFVVGMGSRAVQGVRNRDVSPTVLRVLYAVAWIAYVFLASMRASTGKVMHNDVTGLWCTAFFLFAPLDAHPHDREPNGRYGWPIRSALAFACCAYFFAGYWKMVRTGPAWVFGDNVQNSIAWGPRPEVPRWEGLADFVTQWTILGVLIGLVTILFELAAPFALFVRRSQPLIGAVAIVLHLGVYLMFGLDYWMWIAMDLLVFFDWTRITERRTRNCYGRIPVDSGTENRR